MIPTKLVNIFVLVLGCMVSMYFGAYLPEYDELAIYLVGTAVVATLCVWSNNFPLLIGLGIWFPLPPPIPVINHLPILTLVMAWFLVVIFFRVCLLKQIAYVPSCNWFIFIIFLWVPIRFLINPSYKLGGFMGGQGVSGLNAYFGYFFAFLVIALIGCITPTRKQVIDTLIWSYRVAFWTGVTLLICAFNPVTQPFLVEHGMFNAGSLGDGIARLVVLPGYGLFIMMVAQAPNLFKLPTWKCIIYFFLGFTFIVVGGNRSALAALIFGLPPILILRRKVLSAALMVSVAITGIVFLNAYIEGSDASSIPPLLRSFGVFNSKIDDATGGAASANWRYDVWASGLTYIMESPLIGKGFGGIDGKNDAKIQTNGAPTSDFEAILAGGEAHNGFLDCAYGFGIPFTLALAAIVLMRTFSHMRSAMMTDREDVELIDFHAFMAGLLCTYWILVYTAFDMSTSYFWLYMGLGIVMDHRAVQHRVLIRSLVSSWKVETNQPVRG